MAAVPDSKLRVDQLILLATPVLQSTESYVEDPMFRKIVSLHCVTDLTQVGLFYSAAGSKRFLWLQWLGSSYWKGARKYNSKRVTPYAVMFT